MINASLNAGTEDWTVYELAVKSAGADAEVGLLVDSWDHGKRIRARFNTGVITLQAGRKKIRLLETAPEIIELLKKGRPLVVLDLKKDRVLPVEVLG